MLNLEVARITYRDDSDHFNLSNVESWAYPSAWKEKGEVDVIFVNRFEKEGVGGRTKMPCFGKTVVVAFVGNLEDAPDKVMNTEDVANILVHEIGHYLGLGHGTADKDTDNIMFEDFAIGTPLPGRELWVDQVREMQDRLANDISRRATATDATPGSAIDGLDQAAQQLPIRTSRCNRESSISCMEARVTPRRRRSGRSVALINPRTSAPSRRSAGAINIAKLDRLRRSLESKLP